MYQNNPYANSANQCLYQNRNPSNQCPNPNQNYAYANFQHHSGFSQMINPCVNNQTEFYSQSYTNTNVNGVEMGPPPYPNFQQPYNPNLINAGMAPNIPSQSIGYPQGIPPIPGVQYRPQMPVSNGINYPSMGVNSIAAGYYGQKPKQRYTPTTLKPALNPNLSADPAADALALNKAYKGFGCNKEAIRNIIARRNCAQRERIKQEYSTRFGKSLIADTISELREPYEYAMVSLLWTGSDLDAFMLYKASKGLGTDDSAFRDIICTRSFEQLCQIKASYQNIYSESLENVVISETSGSFRDILLHLLSNPRDQSPTIDFELARRDASELHSTKVFKISAPSSLMNIFAKRSNMQLLQTFITYQEMSGKTVYHYLKQFISTNYEKCLITIHNFIANPIRYYSKQLRDGIRSKSIHQIIRVVSSRCEFDICTIIEDYNFTYKSNFANDLRKEFLRSAGEDTLDTIIILIGEK